MLSQANENVVRMPARERGQRPRKAQKTSPGFRRRMARQAAWAIVVGSVAVVMTALSLTHLSHGIALVTSAPTWEAWAMAIGIDLGFLALEGAQLSAATPGAKAAVERYTKPAIIGTLGVSAVLNALAFGAQASGWMVYPAVLLGLAIPAMVYALSRVAFELATRR